MKMKGQLTVKTPASDLDEKALVALIKETTKMGIVA
jgi:hypothetical protein